MDKLKKLRERIDWLDTQIASLLNERMNAVDQVGAIKRRMKQDVADPKREMNVLHQVETLIQHPLLKASIAPIYQEILHESKTVQYFLQHLSLPFRKIGLIGMGMMGGSIVKGLKTKDSNLEIATLEWPSEDILLAQEGSWIDHVYRSIEELVENSELLILASPLSTLLPLVEKIKCHDKKLTVIDLSSVKEEIVECFEKCTNQDVEYISTHPMAGKEKKGFANSQATLFVDRPWVIVPHKNNSVQAMENVKELILFLGANPLYMEAKRHDRQAALISHLPTLLSKLYFDFVNSIDPESLKIAGPGFQSFTRLAKCSQELHEELITYNQQIVYETLDQWMKYIRENKEEQT